MLGKLLGGGIGLFLGGPIGALLGVALGHALDAETDAYQREHSVIVCPRCSAAVSADSGVCGNCGYSFADAQYQRAVSENAYRQTAFITVFVAICAKMAQADGKVDAGEVRVVKEFFKNQLRSDEKTLEYIKNIFKEALNNEHNIYNLLNQWKTLSTPQINLELLNLLYKIALSDGELQKTEEDFINNIVSTLGISEVQHNQIRGMYINTASRYYDILGISKDADVQEIKKAYRALVTQYHPDKLLSKGLPEDMINFATEKMNKINEAYDEIRKLKKF